MKQKWFNIGISIVVAAVLVAGLYAFNAVNRPEARGVQHFGDITAGGWLIAGAQTAVSVTEQAYITATGTYQPLTSAAAYSASLGTAIMSGTAKGQLLILTNENAADAITIPDNANTKLGGDKVLTGGEGDALFLEWNDVDWLCIGYNDN